MSKKHFKKLRNLNGLLKADKKSLEDIDYIEKLNPDERVWLETFVENDVNARFQKDGSDVVTDITEQRNAAKLKKQRQRMGHQEMIDSSELGFASFEAFLDSLDNSDIFTSEENVNLLIDLKRGFEKGYFTFTQWEALLTTEKPNKELIGNFLFELRKEFRGTWSGVKRIKPQKVELRNEAPRTPKKKKIKRALPELTKPLSEVKIETIDEFIARGGTIKKV